ncbi:exosome complex component RRP45-like isoform X1 [Teleopsis dalmanni]|uniref:exosome complex component RRP45-like isoform X1 n=1 Tax=Teleopsis dalmanni TaxID=139649 RepID=UPI0018CFA37B|nr:exosome complex component RRP45-like isoform X1 [Teleopsis dalmanni]
MLHCALYTERERKFICDLIKSNARPDGRKIDEFRQMKINFGADWGSVMVSLGKTKVLVQASCDLGVPKATRPNEGVLFINVEIGPMASPQFEIGRQGSLVLKIKSMLERTFKESGAVDLESLCVKAEECVWILRIDINVLNHDGNLTAACAIGTVAALAHFRRPDVSIIEGDVNIHPASEKDFIPMVLHHYPICVTYAIFDDGQITLADPTFQEERASQSELVFGINSYREICCFNLGGSAQVAPRVLVKCLKNAADKSIAIIEQIKVLVETDLANRTDKKTVCFSDTLNLQEVMNTGHVIATLTTYSAPGVKKMETNFSESSNDDDSEMYDESSDVDNATLEEVISLGKDIALLQSNQSDIECIVSSSDETSTKKSETKTLETKYSKLRQKITKGTKEKANEDDGSDSEEETTVILK